MVYFMTVLNHTLTCFEKYQQVDYKCVDTVLASVMSRIRCLSSFTALLSPQGNYTELCKNCKSSYKELNELYSRKEKNDTMCIDIEDSVCPPPLWLEERKLHPLEESGHTNEQS